MITKNENIETLRPEIFATIISLTALIMAYSSTVGFNYKNQHLLNSFFVSLFLIFFPVSVNIFFTNYKKNKWYLSKIFLLFLSFLILILISLIDTLIEYKIVFIIYFFSVCFVFYSFANKNSYTKLKVWFIFFSIIFAVIITAAYYENYYLHPLIYEKIATGSWAHRDNIYHASIAGMFKTYFYAGTGLDGFVYHYYHKISHIIFGLISNLVQTNTLIFYSVNITVIFFPVFFLSFLFAIEETNKIYNYSYSINKINIDDNFFCLLLLLTFAVPWPKYIAPENYGYLQSQSYFFSLILFFILIGLIFNFFNSKKNNILNKNYSYKKNDFLYLLIIIFLFFITILTKVSFFYVLNIILIYLYLRLKLFKFLFFNLFFFSMLLINFILLKFWVIEFNATIYSKKPEVLDIMKSIFVREHSLIGEISFFYTTILFILFKIFFLINIKKFKISKSLKSLRTLDIEILLILILALFIVTFEYFKGIQIYISYILILSHYPLIKEVFFNKK